MRVRFYLPAGLTNETLELPESEAHHARAVLRLTPGDDVVVFDGAGAAAAAKIKAVSKSGVVVERGEIERQAPGAIQLTLLTALPKGDRFDWLVEKATELGVNTLQPVLTARSVVNPREAKLDRLRNVVVSACKQCRRNWLMDLLPPIPWSQAINRPDGERLLIADPHGRSPAELAAEISGWSEHLHDAATKVNETLSTFRDSVARVSTRLAIAIGPEGGLTDDEIAQAIAAGAQRMRLAEHILRIETAAVAAAAHFAVR